MKALTVQQPWAWAIAAGHKDVENRTWVTDYRGPLAIHAGKTIDRDGIPAFRSVLEDKGIVAPEEELPHPELEVVLRDQPVGDLLQVSGLSAFLVELEHVERVEGDDLVDFFVVEIAHEPWQGLTERQRIALVDHELCHLDVELTDKGETKLTTRGHDLEEFTEVVKRHGLWRPQVAEFHEVAKAAQLAFPINAGSAGDVLRTGAGLRMGQQGGGDVE